MRITKLQKQIQIQLAGPTSNLKMHTADKLLGVPSDIRRELQNLTNRHATTDLRSHSRLSKQNRGSQNQSIQNKIDITIASTVIDLNLNSGKHSQVEDVS